MNKLLHYSLIPLKLLGVIVLNAWHGFKERSEWRRVPVIPGYPKNKDLEIQFAKCRKRILADGLTEEGLLKTNPDHQAIRHAAMCWAIKSPEHVDVLLSELISGGEFKRGIIESNADGSKRYADVSTPPAVPISLAFAIACVGQSHVSRPALWSYAQAQRRLRENDYKLFEARSDLGPWSTGFNALYAAAVSSPVKTEDHLITHWPLAYRPITYWKNRAYHIDHLTMLCCYTIIKLSDEKRYVKIAKSAMRYVFELSSWNGNPFFAALMSECGILTKEEARYVLQAHKNAHLLISSRVMGTKHLKHYPFDWSKHGGNEFQFDDYQGQASGFTELSPPNYLRGLVLGRSLLQLKSQL